VSATDIYASSKGGRIPFWLLALRLMISMINPLTSFCLKARGVSYCVT